LLSSTDYRSAALRLREAGRKIDLETGSAALRPDLAFFASLDASGQTPPFSRSDWTETWAWDLSLGISIQADLFDAGASAARIEEARSQRLAAAAALHGEETAARLDARKALQAALEAEATLRSVEARAAWTAELLRNAQSSAENQLSSRQDLNAAAIQDATARLELLSARYTFEEALADIDRLGQGATP
ncbi:MAG TPA: TolC family protein, partial [Rectinemataceae bacterium]|nr:TolC family protein [Rectinemataceae bacterium]